MGRPANVKPAFMDDDKKEVVNTRELKLSNKRSRFTEEAERKKKEEEIRQGFEKRARDVAFSEEKHKTTSVELTKEFFLAIRDKTLPELKGVIAHENEKVIRERWRDLIHDLNNDVDQPYDGAGSLAAIYMLMKTLFEQRDRINLLEYKLVELGNKVVKMQKNDEQ